MSELSNLLKAQPISARQASELASERDIHLPYGTIAGYWAGTNRHKPSHATLTALSEVLDIPLAKLQKAAWDTTAPLGVYTPPRESVLLDLRQRKAIDELIRSVVASNGVLHEHDHHHADSPSKPGTPSKGRKTQEAGLVDSPEVTGDLVAAWDNLTEGLEHSDSLSERRKSN